MFFQSLVFFTAVVWAAGFAVFGLYLAFRRGAPVLDRFVGLIAALLVGGVGAALMIGGFYLLDELI